MAFPVLVLDCRCFIFLCFLPNKGAGMMRQYSRAEVFRRRIFVRVDGLEDNKTE